jgi:hypothetical protein
MVVWSSAGQAARQDRSIGDPRIFDNVPVLIDQARRLKALPNTQAGTHYACYQHRIGEGSKFHSHS